MLNLNKLLFLPLLSILVLSAQGEAAAASSCDRYTGAVCEIVAPSCPDGLELAILGACDFACVDPATCAEPPPCGGHLGQGCAEGAYCHYELPQMCGAFDQTGVCLPRPTRCDRNFAPVCGCDGNTYANACNAHAAGQSVFADGTCPPLR
jgi:hypothetical protein